MTKTTRSGQIQAAVLIGTSAGAAAVATFSKGEIISMDTATRLSMIMIGLVLAYQGNVTPKSLPVLSARQQAYKRLSGRLFALSGLAFAAFWALAPLDLAAPLSMAPVAITMVTVFVVCLSNRVGPTKPAD